KQKQAAQAAVEAAREGLRESEDAVRAGNLLDVASSESRVRLLQGRQALLSAEIRISDLNSEMNDLLGLPLDTELAPAEISDTFPVPQTLPEYLREALSRNPELQAAQGSVEKAGHAVAAARDEYIPDVSLFARYTYQDGVPFVENNIGTFGVRMTWDIFDWGGRSGVVGQRRSQLNQARENLKRIEQRITVEISKAYRKLELTRTMLDVATEALKLQRENQRLSADRVKAGTTTRLRHAESVAAVRKAELDELQAELGYRLALAELDRIAGSSAR
ncbi:MAG TPA: TolC family protein, partial [Geobacteraceae bacterium]|nr:TolC family protein [Geobacteraceae bacterium]